MHGGKTPIGAALPQFRTGRHSKYLPTRLAARYQEAQADPDLISLRDDVALLDARLSELVERVEDEDGTTLWFKARAALDAYATAQQRGSRDQATALGTLEAVIQEGCVNGGAVTWREVLGLLEQRRRLVESESKRLQMLQQMIPAEQALLLLGLIEQVIRKHVLDRTQLAAISADLSRLAALPPGRVIDAD